MQTVSEFIQMMQASIASVAMISGVGLLLLSMTNRFARIIDRTRSLDKEMCSISDPAERDKRIRQINILYSRTINMRRAVTLASASIFFVALTIFIIFISQLFRLEWTIIPLISFSFSLLSLVFSLIFFMRDFRVSLTALELEIENYIHRK